jgi:predicted PurR-regulated permease PerM
MPDNGARAWTVTGVILALVFAAYFLPHVVSVVLLIFAGTVLGVVLNAITARMDTLLPGGRRIALLGMGGVVGLAITLLAWLVIPQLVREVPELVSRLPEAWQSLRERVADQPLIEPLLAETGAAGQLMSSGLLGRLTGVVSGFFDLLFNLFVITLIGIFLALDPPKYRRVALYPFTQQRRVRGDRLCLELERELRFWVIGRACSMTIVGVLVGVGLWGLGMSLAFTLGLIAGVLSFVPYLGPVIALVPALVIGFADQSVFVGAVLLLYAAIQVLESYVLTPLIQQRAVDIPPAILLAMQLIGGVFGGVLGILLAAPTALIAAAVAREAVAANGAHG